VLAGATSFTAVGEWVADAPPQVLAALGVRCDPLTRRFVPPDEATIRRVLEAADAGALDAAVGSWLDARLQAAGQAAGHARRPRRAVAVDGKAVRATRHASADGQPVYLLAALDRRCGVVLGQVRGTARPTRSPGSRRCSSRWTWPGASSPPTRCTPSASTPSSLSRKSRRTTSWS
jgi:hypothetical protein